MKYKITLKDSPLECFQITLYAKRFLFWRQIKFRLDEYKAAVITILVWQKNYSIPDEMVIIKSEKFPLPACTL